MSLSRSRLRALPKAELHVHLEGSVTVELGAQLAARNGAAVPPPPPAGTFASFSAFVGTYLAICRCFRAAEDFEDAVVDLARRQALAGVVWAEVTFTPMAHVGRGLDPAMVAEGLAAGRRRAAAEHGVGIGWVFDIVRSFPEAGGPTLEFMRRVERLDPGSVLALGLGGPEDEAPGEAGVEAAFGAARAEGFHSLPHAGELAGAASVWEAVRRLGAERIGHGVRCLEDPELVAHLVEHGIVLEVCPTSNLRLGVAPTLAEHPLPKLREAGLAVTLATDDPALFGCDLLGEYEACATAFGWSEADVVGLVAASLRHSFMPDADKRRWLAEVERLSGGVASSSPSPA